MTVSEARKLFGNLAGQNNSFIDRLNEVQSRLIAEGNFKGTKVPTRFVVYTDAFGNNVVTLPRELETILAGAYQAPNPNNVLPGTFWCGHPLPIQNGWHQFSPTGPGNLTGSDALRGIIPIEGRYTTFTDWSEPMTLRIKLEQDESPGGKIIFRGTLSGEKIYSQDGDEWIEGVALSYSNATVTTTKTFDAPPYQIIKPVTKGRIRLYSVDTDGNETIAGYYDPSETAPSYKRFIVPACPST